MKKSSRFGFSLIELSVVILIIGILVLGITQGSRIIGEAKLKSAQSLTQSSAVNSIEGLHLWMESTSEKSFDANTTNNSLISNWYDINSQNNTKYTFTSSGSSRPTYNSSGMNGLPSIQFNGSSSYLRNNNFTFPYSNYTVFAVFNLSVNDSSRDILTLTSAVAGQAGMQIETQSGGVIRILHRFPYSGAGGDSFNSSSGVLSINQNYIMSYTRNLPALITKARINNTIVINSTPTVSSFDSTTLSLWIGCLSSGSRVFSGNIGEIIIFNRALIETERQNVESYLSTKWGVRLN